MLLAARYEHQAALFNIWPVASLNLISLKLGLSCLKDKHNSSVEFKSFIKDLDFGTSQSALENLNADFYQQTMKV